MIGLDTNVLVRYLAQDDPQQSPKATRLIESLTQQMPGHVTVVAMAELVWVLADCYATPKSEICAILEKLLRTKELQIAQGAAVWQALREYRTAKADFADCLINKLAQAAGCTHTATFDRGAAKSDGMRLID